MSDGKIKGVAPCAEIVAVRVLDHRGRGKLSAMIEGICFLLSKQKELAIRIVNISVGAIVVSGRGEHSELVKAVNALWDAGIVVCTAAGNEGGRDGGITTPGISRKTITVGSYDDAWMIDETGQSFSNYSGKGPTGNCICKPEIVAPGTNIISTNVKKSKNDYAYSVKSGTSMSTPIVSGAVALLLERYPDITNSNVKLRLRETAIDMNLPSNHQGWGKIGINRMLYGF